uniref:RING finger protein 11-like isoform X2 n=1 Tax=Hirondellea gigas TaxID=1518452 RepID=A0A6A7FUG3_9CRUS
MLPQVVCSSMDSDTSNSIEPSLPPDICLKSCDAGEIINEAVWSGGGGNTQQWKRNRGQRHQDHNSSSSSGCIEVMEEVNTVALQDTHVVVTQSDLLQSAFSDRHRSDGRKSNTKLDTGTSILPDLCEAANTCSCSASSSSSQRLPNVKDDTPQHAGSDSFHEALGAKPKVFKCKSGSKTRTESDAHKSSGNNMSTKKGSRDLKRTNETSHLSNSVCNDSLVKYESDLEFSGSALTDNSKSLNTRNISEDNKSSENSLLSRDVTTISDCIVPNKASKSTKDSLVSFNESEGVSDVDKSKVSTKEMCSSLTEDYLMYDNRPISLVACGILDCDGTEQAATTESSSDTTSGAGHLLVRNNLHSASHPMFSKWPCEAYIPSHILVEVAFTSHGTSLAVAASSESNTTTSSLAVYGSSVSAAADAAAQIRESEQVKLAKRMGLIHHLPQGTVDACTSVRECVICMMDFIEGEKVRYLPCMHCYHTHCIDDWFQRAFTCPSCLEPVDAALLNTYNTT